MAEEATEQTYYKSDPANPESPLVYAPEVAEDGPADPEPVTLKEGETAAQFESHVLVTAPQKIKERIEKEQEENLSAEQAASQQAAETRNKEWGRVSAPEPPEESDEEKRTAARERSEAVSAMREAIALPAEQLAKSRTTATTKKTPAKS